MNEVNVSESIHGVRFFYGYSEVARLHYVLTLPPTDQSTESTDRFPLIVFLHSLEERGSELQNLLNNPNGQGMGLAGYALENPRFTYATLSPLCPKRGYWTFLHSRLARLIRDVSGSPWVNSELVFISGVSMGAIGTWSFSMAHPKMVRGLIPIAGGVYSPPIIPRYRRIAHVPVLAFHDSNDPSIPVKIARSTMDSFLKVGGKGDLVETNTGEHYINSLVFHSKEFHTWLEENTVTPGR